MNKEDLRPIGTKYKQEYQFDPMKFLDHSKHIFEYEIVAHSEIHISGPNSPLTWIEEIKCIDEQTFDCLCVEYGNDDRFIYRFSDGSECHRIPAKIEWKINDSI